MALPPQDSNNSDSDIPSHVIALGASAGGLEALQGFFSNISCNTGAAFVVIQHLSPDFKSMMSELLGKNTQMPIYQVIDGMELERDSIYLIPPRQNMSIKDNQLMLSEQSKDVSFQAPINYFFHSLGHDKKHQAIGIILSGTGSDGSNGIKSLKEAGGLVIVQNKKSAKFDGMPSNAKNTGMVDISLEPNEMGNYIERYIKNPYISGQTPLIKNPDNDENITLAEMFSLLENHSGIDFSDYKETTVARRIKRRTGVNELVSLEDYLNLMRQQPEEVKALYKDLLIGVTRFFRDTEAFEVLEQQIIPTLVENALQTGQDIRIWATCCSSGEEAYSLAILLDEALSQKDKACNIKIFATDIDQEAIARASTGCYRQDTLENVSEARLKRYFTKSDGYYVVSQQLRQMIVFAKHNIIEDAPFSNIDLVSCRNALIYFRHTTQKRVLSTLYFALKKNGYLFLGNSETLSDLKTQFGVVNEKHRLYCKSSNHRIPLGSPNVVTSDKHKSSMKPISSLIRPIKEEREAYFNTIKERLIQQYTPDCIVLNNCFDAVHVYGNVHDYTQSLSSGKVSNNIKDIIIEELNVAVSTALYKAETNKQDIFYKDVTFKVDQADIQIIDLAVLFVETANLKKQHQESKPFYILAFKKVNTNDPLSVEFSFDAEQQSRQHIRDLENELVKKQEHLQITIEELETTNEELQSSNEELMSANEELQSTNEELQSVNEELYTINAEYQQKIGELTLANNYLDYVINASKIGMIFLDADLTIGKFTPITKDYINLMESDIGRPFHHISHQLDYDDLYSDIVNVNSTQKKKETVITTRNNHKLIIQISPYLVESNRVAGVLISINDMSLSVEEPLPSTQTQQQVTEQQISE